MCSSFKGTNKHPHCCAAPSRMSVRHPRRGTRPSLTLLFRCGAAGAFAHLVRVRSLPLWSVTLRAPGPSCHDGCSPPSLAPLAKQIYLEHGCSSLRNSPAVSRNATKPSSGPSSET